MKVWIVLISLFYFSYTSNTSIQYNTFELKSGDILFQDLDSSPICDAIELVTPGYNGGNFSHIGLVISQNDTLKILEAIPPKVTITNLDNFLNRSSDQNGNPKVIVGRLIDEYKNTIAKAIEFAKQKIGVDYDEYFMLDNDKYYCSELIYDAFSPYFIFKLEPMNFLDPTNNDTLSTWKEYYSKIGIQVPQNELGINPGVMSLSEKIQIIHFYGNPDGIIR